MGLTCLRPADVFHGSFLGFEHIPLRLQIQAAIYKLVILLLRFTVSPKQSRQDPQSPPLLLAGPFHLPKPTCLPVHMARHFLATKPRRGLQEISPSFTSPWIYRMNGSATGDFMGFSEVNQIFTSQGRKQRSASSKAGACTWLPDFFRRRSQTHF